MIPAPTTMHGTIRSRPPEAADRVVAPPAAEQPAALSGPGNAAVHYGTTGTLRADIAAEEAGDADLALAEGTVSAARRAAETIGNLLQEVRGTLAVAESSADDSNRTLEATVDSLLQQVATIAASPSFGAAGKLLAGSSRASAGAATATGTTRADPARIDSALLVEQALTIQEALRLELGRAASVAEDGAGLDLPASAVVPEGKDGAESPTSALRRKQGRASRPDDGNARLQRPDGEPGKAASSESSTAGPTGSVRESVEAMLEHVLDYARALRALQGRLAAQRLLMRKLALEAGRALRPELLAELTPAGAALQSWQVGRLLAEQLLSIANSDPQRLLALLRG